MKWLIESVGMKAVTFQSADAFLEIDRIARPACLVLDIRMPGLSGLSLQSKLNQTGQDIPIIFLTAYGDVPVTTRAFKAGAMDFFEKPCNDQDLLEAIISALGKDTQRQEHRMRLAQMKQRLGKLSRRERQVLYYLSEGMTSKQVSGILNLSTRTVEAHRANILNKLDVKNLVELLNGLVQAGSNLEEFIKPAEYT
jgi:two-component system, LuxR family, response regulator FixJ